MSLSVATWSARIHIVVDLKLVDIEGLVALYIKTLDVYWELTTATGGTAFNGVVEELKNLTTRVAHVLPVSDDGGSTAEIVRVLGMVKSSNSFYSVSFLFGTFIRVH